MEILNKVDYGYLLQRSLTDLHQESIDWISEIKFLETEFSYFRKVLNRFSKPEQPKRFEIIIDDLNRNLTDLQHEIIEKFGAEVKIHEVYLSELLDILPGHDDSTYREKHQEVTEHYNDLSSNLKAFKKQLFDFVIEAK